MSETQSTPVHWQEMADEDVAVGGSFGSAEEEVPKLDERPHAWFGVEPQDRGRERRVQEVRHALRFRMR